MTDPTRLTLELSLYDRSKVRRLLELVGEVVVQDLIEHLTAAGEDPGKFSDAELEELLTYSPSFPESSH